MTDPRRFARHGRWQPVERSSLFWVSDGDENAGTPVVFLHGIPTWSWLWRNVLPVTGRTHRSIAVDLPGFGLSDKSPEHSFRVCALAGSVLKFLDTVIGEDESFNLVCHDFGALVAAEMVHQRPGWVEHLVITNTSLRPDAWTGGGPLRILGVPMLGNLSMAMAQQWMLGLAMRPFVTDRRAMTREVVAGYWYPFEAGFRQSLARLYRERPFERDDFLRWREALARFRGRALVGWGERDPAFTLAEAADLVDLLPSSEYLGFENANHFLMEERPMALGRRIGTFLAGR